MDAERRPNDDAPDTLFQLFPEGGVVSAELVGEVRSKEEEVGRGRRICGWWQLVVKLHGNLAWSAMKQLAKETDPSIYVSLPPNTH